MKKESLLLVGVTLIVGVLVGVLVTKGGKGDRQAPAPAAQAPTVNYSQQINLLEGMVKNDPTNRSAWVQLGNLYFDSDDPVKAVEAYNKALELDSEDANVITDQGVMFRRLGWFDKAVENFKKASEIDPTHKQSLFNLGIVYRYDFQDFEKAKIAWQKFLERSPTGPQADQVRSELEFLETHPSIPQQQ